VKNLFRKYGYLTVFSIILVVMGIYGYMNTGLPEWIAAIPVSFTVEDEEHTVDIELYRDENACYVFLPSYASLEKVKINTSAIGTVLIDSEKVKDGTYCEEYELGKEYSFEVNHHKDMTLQFLQSANVAAMYIDTATGGMERIHKDKEYEEPVSVRIVSDDGRVDCYDMRAHLNGRGNSTWNPDKKPYSLTLSEDKSLLGMSDSSKWVLIANAFDETNLRNKLVFDFAAKTSLEWSPSCRYVDVYLNGSYNGLYLLVERIAVGEKQLDLDLAKGDFLCKADLADRWEYMSNPFISSIGRELEITEPKKLSALDKKRIHEAVAIMEQNIMDGRYPDLDLDSWVCRYLIDEVFANGDADLTSSYFYCKDDIFYAGPVWDYDKILGNSIRNENPRAFVAKNYRKAPYFDSQYYEALCTNSAFQEQVVEMYKTEFVPILTQLVDSEIDAIADEIKDASQMNSIRWREIYSQSTSKVPTVDGLKKYMQDRRDFLESAWIEGTEYCTVQIQLTPDDNYYNAAVVKGDYLDASYLGNADAVWLHAENQEEFDITQPIMTDIQLIQKW